MESVELVCPICLCYYDAAGYAGAGDKCGDRSGKQQRNCVGRLIPREEWEQREYPYDRDWAADLFEAIALTAGFPEHIPETINSIVRGIIRFGKTADVVKAQGIAFTREIMAEVIEQAFEVETLKTAELSREMKTRSSPN